MAFDTIVFVPNAGKYISGLFIELFGDSFEIEFITVRRAFTVTKINPLKEFIFKRKWLSNIMRHVEVLLRVIKYKTGLRHNRIIQHSVDFDVKNKKILVIDDSVDTGTTLKLIKRLLLNKGAQSVTTACISNHLLPKHVHVDYAVHTYALLRTINSRDYYAT